MFGPKHWWGGQGSDMHDAVSGVESKRDVDAPNHGVALLTHPPHPTDDKVPPTLDTEYSVVLLLE